MESFILIIHRLGTSDSLLASIQEKIKWADTMSEFDKKHRKDVEERVEEVKNSLSFKVSSVHLMSLCTSINFVMQMIRS